MTRFTELVGCPKPVQLAGMGSIGADGALPAAVTRAGGLGMLGAAGMPLELLRERLEELATAGPFGVNFLMPFLDVEALDLAAREAPVMEFFYGDPDAFLVERARRGGAIVGWQVGSTDEAAAAVAAGCDYVIAQGLEAGGHVRGTTPQRELLIEVVREATVPVVAAGGLGRADDVETALDAGASAVRVGTRFVAASESNAHPDYVEALRHAGAGDTVLTRAFSLGWDAPHRVLRSCVDAAGRAGDTVGTTVHGDESWPIPRFSVLPPTTDTRGDVAAMSLYAGASVEAVKNRQTAAEIVDELTAGL